MENFLKYIFAAFIVAGIIGMLTIGIEIANNITEDSIKTEETISQENYHSPAPTFFTQSSEEGLIEALDYYNVQYPQIVYAQALLETGHFTSRVCKEYNNLFGLYNSKIKDYYKFDHWSDSVKAYVDFVQYKYKEGDYYYFLINLPYAEDPNYINKIKSLEKYYGRNSKRTNEH